MIGSVKVPGNSCLCNTAFEQIGHIFTSLWRNSLQITILLKQVNTFCVFVLLKSILKEKEQNPNETITEEYVTANCPLIRVVQGNLAIWSIQEQDHPFWKWFCILISSMIALCLFPFGLLWRTLVMFAQQQIWSSMAPKHIKYDIKRHRYKNYFQ